MQSVMKAETTSKAEVSPERSLLETMTQFHRQRVLDISSGKLRLHDNSCDDFLVLHFLPESGFSEYRLIDPALLSEVGKTISPLGARRAYSRFNVDGFLHHSGYQSVDAYTLLQRDGRIESLMPSIKYPANRAGSEDGPFLFRDGNLDKGVLEVTKEYLSAVDKLGVACPIWLFSCIVGCKDVHITTNPEWGEFSETKLGRSPCFLPPIQIKDTESAASVARTWSDHCWQAFGMERSFNFDENGEWRERRRY